MLGRYRLPAFDGIEAIRTAPELARKGGVVFVAVLLQILSLGCAARFTGTNGPEPLAQQALLPAYSTKLPAPAAAHGGVNLAAYQEPDRSKAENQMAVGAKIETNGHSQKEELSQSKQKITLPLAIQMCITQNFRVRAGAERVRQAHADLITASLIPNATLFADYQLIPLQRADINNQLGPPQADVLLSVPIDWLVFGKRVAAMQAARLGIDVSNADYADLHRLQVGRTVDAFYEILATEKYLKLAEENLEELQSLEKLTEELAKTKKVGSMELDRVKLAVLEALLERHERERAFEVAKAHLRPFIGLAIDQDFEVVGILTVPTMVVPPPKLADAVALAEAQRPDLISVQQDINRARAVVDLERRRAKPQVAVVPGWNYQIQRHIDGFRDGSMFDIGVATTLPITDRNQGNILKARAREYELRHTYQGDRADVLAEVETAVLNYQDAVEHLGFNSPETLKAAHDLRKNMEAAYRAGDRKLHEMLLAHQAYRDRLTHVVEFASDYYRTLNKLNMAVGLKAYDQETGATQRAGVEENKKE
jgi:cobalt-zinc-cadmium efflux system outer membrane protein